MKKNGTCIIQIQVPLFALNFVRKKISIQKIINHSNASRQQLNNIYLPTYTKSFAGTFLFSTNSAAYDLVNELLKFEVLELSHKEEKNLTLSS